MRCEEVQEKLPEYLAGVLDEDTKSQVDDHIENCDICGSELKELNKGITIVTTQKNGVNEKRILRKTKFKFNLAIIRIVAIIVGVLFLILMIPSFLWGIQSALAQPKASRALMDIVQFSQPNKVTLWGNSVVEGFSFSVPLHGGVTSIVGRKYREQKQYEAKMSVITGRITPPHFLGANFLHPNLFAGEDFGRERSVDVQVEILKKNADTTVTTVDYSLNKIIGLKDVESIISKYDVEILWMAVEAGIEDVEPKNMSFGNQQVLQWGIPGKLSKPGNFDFAQLKSGNLKEFEEAVISELKWLDSNKDILKPDSGLLKNNGIDNSVKGQVKYIIENGIKIYGLRITGPSNELIKLTKDLDIRTMSVIDMDFWNW